MRIRVAVEDHSAAVHLEDTANFREFLVVAEQVDSEAVAAAISEANAGELIEGYAWIRRSYIETQAPSTPADWSTNFAKMIEFAEKHGWISPDGQSIRAHIETR